MDYSILTKTQLIDLVEELQVLNRHLLSESERQTGLDFAVNGNLGYWYWNIKTNTVTCNELKAEALGYSREEIPERASFQYFAVMLHPEDYSKTMNAMFDHLNGTADVYEAEYRIRTKSGGYKWFFDRGRITRYDDQGKPLLVAGVVFDVTGKKENQSEPDHEKPE